MEYNVNLEESLEEDPGRTGTSFPEHSMVNWSVGKPKIIDIELQKLKDWGAYRIVKDEGQFRNNST